MERNCNLNVQVLRKCLNSRDTNNDILLVEQQFVLPFLFLYTPVSLSSVLPSRRATFHVSRLSVLHLNLKFTFNAFSLPVRFSNALRKWFADFGISNSAIIRYSKSMMNGARYFFNYS